jgi:hypothetical protein
MYPLVVPSIHYYGERVENPKEANIVQPQAKTYFYNKYLNDVGKAQQINFT